MAYRRENDNDFKKCRICSFFCRNSLVFRHYDKLTLFRRQFCIEQQQLIY